MSLDEAEALMLQLSCAAWNRRNSVTRIQLRQNLFTVNHDDNDGYTVDVEITPVETRSLWERLIGVSA